MVDLTPTQPQVLSVYELTRAVRALLEEGVGEVWVEGEVSNFRRQASGHQYFTLKDDRSQLPCVWFRNAAAASGVQLADGMQVQAHGELTVYESRGQYQLVVEVVQGRGVGALQARFEALKRRLHAEGLFDPARKQDLPAFPLTVGIVTSPTGAALQDMLNILRRRAPWMRVLVHPVRVQGQGASLEIAGAVAEFNAWAQDDANPAAASKRVDLIVVARGGGSIEDLWEFNEEIVARAIAASALPVVSAVGHEIDFTIADFAADLRAPTPSAAAELIAPDTVALRERLDAAAEGFERELRDRIERARERLELFASGTLEKEPRRRLLDARQRLDLAEESLARAATGGLRVFRARLDEKGCCLRASGLQPLLDLRAQTVAALREKIDVLMCCEQAKVKARLHAAEGLLRVLGPQATLERGYSITTLADGTLVSQAEVIADGVSIHTKVKDGSFVSVVTRR